jgi:hypothetical protein
MLTTLRIVPTRKAVIDQGIEIGVSDGKHVAATATVAAIGPAELFVFLMPKRDAASATVSGGDINVGFVNEFHDGCFINNRACAKLFQLGAPTLAVQTYDKEEQRRWGGFA